MRARTTSSGGRTARLRLIMVVVAAMTLLGADWPTFGADPAHTGFNRETAVASENRAALSTLFTAPTGDDIVSSPAVANGIVYVGSSDHKLYAVDAHGAANCSSGVVVCTPLWTASTGSRIVSSPAVASGVVYVGSDDGKLYAFDAAGKTGCSGTPRTCTPLWTAPTGAAVQSSPTVLNGVV